MVFFGQTLLPQSSKHLQSPMQQKTLRWIIRNFISESCLTILLSMKTYRDTNKSNPGEGENYRYFISIHALI